MINNMVDDIIGEINSSNDNKISIDIIDKENNKINGFNINNDINTVDRNGYHQQVQQQQIHVQQQQIQQQQIVQQQQIQQQQIQQQIYQQQSQQCQQLYQQQNHFINDKNYQNILFSNKIDKNDIKMDKNIYHLKKEK